MFHLSSQDSARIFRPSGSSRQEGQDLPQVHLRHWRRGATGAGKAANAASSNCRGTPVSLRDTITGLDDRNTTLLITAIQHAAGNYSLADDRSRLR